MNQENPTYHYGLTSKIKAITLARQVCEVLGHGSTGCATNLLLETAAAETCLGLYEDPTPGGAGMGLCQHDLIAFQADQLLMFPFFSQNALLAKRIPTTSHDICCMHKLMP